MKTISTLLLAAGLLAAADARVFVGVITDTMCGADHKHMGVEPDEKCVRECVKHGAKYALYDGKEIYRLSDQQTPEQFAAKKVKVTGVLYEKTKIIKVEKIEAAQ
jgi:hypothetical protein